MTAYIGHPALHPDRLHTGAQTILPDSHRGPADRSQGSCVVYDPSRGRDTNPAFRCRGIAPHHATSCMRDTLLAPVADVRGIRHKRLHTISQVTQEYCTLCIVLMQLQRLLQTCVISSAERNKCCTFSATVPSSPP